MGEFQRMRCQPIIGILGNVRRDPDPDFVSVDRSYTNTACVRAIDGNGGVPVILPVPEDPRLSDPALALCDGLLFPGGWDLDPRHYGEPPHATLGPVLPELDAFWFHAAAYASEHRVPMLGICRGMQLLDVACGGSLYQDIGEREEKNLLHAQQLRRDTPTHRVLIEPDSRLRRILEAESVYTNTLHHQSVKALGKGLVLTARAEDGVVEAFESPDGLIVAVQWHPEDLLRTIPVMNRLFLDLCGRAQERRGARN